MEQGLRYDPDSCLLEGVFQFREDLPEVGVYIHLDEDSLTTTTLVIEGAAMYTIPDDDTNPYANKFGYIAMKGVTSLVIAWARLHDFKRLKGEFERLKSSSSANPGTKFFDITL
ncbi:MAG: hypothetical protein ACOCZ8_05040 [Bacteroidota bacterium]